MKEVREGTSATRLLVLGVVRVYGQAHGYLVRSELLSWDADAWANIKLGSIYHALKQLCKEGLLHGSEVDAWAGRIDYTLTEAGDAEFLRLLRDALTRPDQRPDLFAAGLAFLPALSRLEAIALLQDRLRVLQQRRDDIRAETRDWGEPAHVRELFGLWVHAADSSATWTRGLITRLEAGAYIMAGEEGQAFGS